MSHDMTKPTKLVCAQRRLRSAWASAQSDQRLRCVLNAFFMWTAKTLIRLGGCPGWSEFSLGAHAILLILSWGSSYLFLFFSKIHILGSFQNIRIARRAICNLILGKQIYFLIEISHIFKLAFVKREFISSPEPLGLWWGYSISMPLSSMYVCMYVCMLSTFSNIFSSETIEADWSQISYGVSMGWGIRAMKVCSNGPGHMTKMVAMRIMTCSEILVLVEVQCHHIETRSKSDVTTFAWYIIEG